MEKLIIKDSTVEKAIQKGLIKLKANRDEVEVTIIEEGKKGLFGFGKKDAEIEISKKNIEKNTVEVVTESIDIEIKSSKLEEVEEVNSTEEVLPEFVNTARHFIEQILKAYGVEASVNAKLTSKKLYLNIETEKIGLVVGKHGKIINSLQVLAQTIIYNDVEKMPMVIVNVGDYRAKREEKLHEIADRTAKRVLKTKQSVFLEPLPAFERKIIHARLSKYEQITTHSEGKEPYRYLVVEYTK